MDLPLPVGPCNKDQASRLVRQLLQYGRQTQLLYRGNPVIEQPDRTGQLPLLPENIDTLPAAVRRLDGKSPRPFPQTAPSAAARPAYAE